MLKTRNRLVNFRVTEEEYEGLKAACSMRGSRCLSDYARTMVLCSTAEAATFRSGSSGLSDQLSAMDRRISELESNLGKLLTANGARAGL